ncbi:histidine phosphatase family protein [Danxiaibacter flavus]|uniref:Histidine phosphatase family protein n=1 Tax=Danxiaibacter flavus TaxID=3049108 RepID=A0ABV3ZK14_9BACT|nr:histidine phosphatase family protein [Chitinophagaceae bacterium DXS]
MKSIIIVRHAKSSWSNNDLPDFERPLNHRGEKDAPEMASRLKKKVPKIDAFISSPAKRALATAAYFAEEYGLKKKEIEQVQQLYLADARNFYDVIRKIDNDVNVVAIFSHNPGITDFVNTLTSTRIDEMPTCAIFAIDADITSWANFADAEKTFQFFDYPKA